LRGKTEMRIGLNLLYLIPGNVGGTQTYAVSLIEALATIDSETESFAIFLCPVSPESGACYYRFSFLGSPPVECWWPWIRELGN
jgi:hypothetical protein